MSKKRPQPASNNSKMMPLVLVGAFIALAISGFLIWSSMQTPAAPGVGPKLVVNQERIELGKQPYGKQVRAEFEIKNVGDQVLVLDASAPVRALEGC